MKTTAIFLLYIFAVMLFVKYGCQYIEQPYTYLNKYHASLHHGNWVPDIFPHSIIEIHKQHDLDNNTVWLRFSITEEDVNTNNLTPIDKVDASYIKPFSTNWWFNTLPNHYQIYLIDNLSVKAFLAMSTKSSIRYYWTHY